MTWEILAHDIAARIEQEEREELWAEAEDLADAERATQLFADRIRAFAGQHMTLALHAPDRAQLSGRLVTSGEDWLLVEDEVAQYLVRMAAVTRLFEGVYAREAPTGLPVSLGTMLRELDGSHVQISCVDGVVNGVITGVGRDYVVLDPEDALARRGSHARSWDPAYEFDAAFAAHALVIPMRVIAVISQARVHH